MGRVVLCLGTCRNGVAEEELANSGCRKEEGKMENGGGKWRGGDRGVEQVGTPSRGSGS